MKFYNGITIVCQRNQKSKSVTCPEKHVGYLSEKHVGYLSRKACRLLVQKKRLEGEKTKTTTTRNAIAEIFGLHAYAKNFKNISKCKSEFV